jgi:membrane-bound lytic murein transglycosylase A
VFNFGKHHALFSLLLCSLLLLNACQTVEKAAPSLSKDIAWSELPGWNDDNHAEAWPALLKGCRKLNSKDQWTSICADAAALENINDNQVKLFIEQHFTPQQLIAEDGSEQGLITGYYEPLLQGSYQATDRYRYPLYGSPKELLTVDLSSLYPDLKGKRVRARVEGNKVVPFYSRSEIESDAAPLEGNELLWVDDRDALFFLQIQGSGRVQLPDGHVIGAGYANQNGHPYVSIGKLLIQREALKREDVTLFSIKNWLKDNPAEAQALLNDNPSYVFFTLREDVNEGPTGSLNVPITAERSLAIDPKVVPLGTAMWIVTSFPDEQATPLKRLVFAQDTGGAIKGRLRADMFWGTGELAEQRAGNMKQKGELYVLRIR